MEELGTPTFWMSGLYDAKAAFWKGSSVPGDEATPPASSRLTYHELLLGGVTTVLDLSAPYGSWLDVIEESGLLAGWTDDPRGWVYERIGTVHTVQGREAEAVILVLGAPAPHQTGARGWAGSRPNLLNVAVTRAKERLYVVGNRELWRQAGLFRTLDERLPPSPSTDR